MPLYSFTVIVMSLEMLAESVGTVAGVQSWRQRIQILGDVTEKLRAPNDVCVNGRVSRLVLEDVRERTGVLKHRRKCKYTGCE